MTSSSPSDPGLEQRAGSGSDDALDQPEKRSAARSMAAVGALTCLFPYVAREPSLLGPTLLLVVALVCLSFLVLRRRISHDLPLGQGLLAIGIVIGIALTLVRSGFLHDRPGLMMVLAPLMAVLAIIASLGPGRRAGFAYVALMVVFAVVALGDIATVVVEIDVQPLLEDGIDAAFSGASPYGITIPNMYDAADTARYYGPGVVENGRVQYGYPYLPVPLLLDIPAHLLGDVRWMHVATLLVAGLLAWTLATDLFGRLASIFLVVNPMSTTVLAAFWVEPLIVFLLTVTIWAMVREKRWAGVPLGLFFASKQYAVSFIPLLWSVRSARGWSTVVTAAGVGTVVVGAFLLWDPQAFVHSVIGFHLAQPFRVDAISLLPGLQARFGDIPGWMLDVAPVVGIAVSLLVVIRTKAGPTAFAMGCGLSLLVTMLLAKQAFMNYYELAGSALLLAVITWDRDDPIPDPTPQTEA